jgi:FG-GAP-like repeat
MACFIHFSWRRCAFSARTVPRHSQSRARLSTPAALRVWAILCCRFDGLVWTVRRPDSNQVCTAQIYFPGENANPTDALWSTGVSSQRRQAADPVGQVTGEYSYSRLRELHRARKGCPHSRCAKRRAASDGWHQRPLQRVLGPFPQKVEPARSSSAPCLGPNREGWTFKARRGTSPFPATPAGHDFSKSYIAWRDTNGDVAIWLMNAANVPSSGGLGQISTVWSIVGQRDSDGDGKSDLLWHDTNGNLPMWLMNSAGVSTSLWIGDIPTAWAVVAIADSNGDAMGDILWEDAGEHLGILLMNSTQVLQAGGIGTLPSGWKVANADGKVDILFENASGALGIWFMNGFQVLQFGSPPGTTAVWSVVGTGDLNGDGYSNILWRDTSNNLGVWLMQGTSVLQAGGLGNVGSNWMVAQTGDFNGDGKSDILYRDTSAGSVAMW